MKIVLEEIVKIMERGQITLPIAIRKELKLTPKSWLSVKLTTDKNVFITPLKGEKAVSLDQLLKNLSQDDTIYWTAADEKKRLKTRKQSTLRLENHL